MNAPRRLAMLVALTALILVAGVLPASAAPSPKPVLYGTTGACFNPFPGGPCTQNSDLVKIDPATGASTLIGPVGHTVTGLAWDLKTSKLFATTAIGCGEPDSVCPFHGLITIDITTGAGTPVNSAVVNFGLAGDSSPIHSLAINGAGRMAAWYDEFGGPTDTFVTIDKATGIATEFPDTGIDSSANGLAYDVFNQLWNIDRDRCTLFDPNGDCQAFGQAAYQLDPKTGKPLRFVALTPPTMAALGDFNPFTNLYYGLRFQGRNSPTFIEVVDVNAGTVTELGRTVTGLHTLAFVKKLK
jgi:hypothetical protein